MGVLVLAGSIDFEIILRVFPYRLTRALDTQGAKDAIESFPGGWKGVIHLQNEFKRMSEGDTAALRRIRAFKIKHNRDQLPQSGQESSEVAREAARILIARLAENLKDTEGQ